MDISVFLLIGLVIALAGLIMTGYPVAFTLAGAALLIGAAGIGLHEAFGFSIGRLDWGYISLFPDRIFGTISNDVLLAVPLFIFMGTLLEKSRVAEDLLETMAAVFGRVRGGLGISVTIVGAIMAASTGIVGATVVTMGLISLPTMLKRGYAPGFAAGSIAAAGTLGQIIPPSIVLVLLSDVLSSAYQQAQRAQGVFSPQPLTVGDLFAGAFLPGLALVGLYIIYQIAIAIFKPEDAPAETTPEHVDFNRLVTALIAPLFLIFAVLGSILWGIATPTEAASLGAVGALFLGGIKAHNGSISIWLGLISTAIVLGAPLLISFERDSTLYFFLLALTPIMALGGFMAVRTLFKAKTLQDSMLSTLQITAMVFSILIGAALFSLVFRGLGGEDVVHALLTDLPGGATGALIAVMLVMFILGFFLDFIEITFIVVPIVAPTLFLMGFDPIWLGVMMAINLQTSFLTPPFGFALFYLRGVASEALKTVDLYKGVIPFIAIQLLALILLAAFPQLATWLPAQIFG